MLLDNFRPLIYFGTPLDTVFKDTNGDIRTAQSVVSSATPSNVSDLRNSHSYKAVVRSFDYTATAASNSYTDELAQYSWNNMLIYHGGSTTPPDVKCYSGFILFVGTGDTPVESSDYKLDSRIVLDVLGASCTQSPNGVVTVMRNFANNTGSDVLIKEVGLYMFMQSTIASYPVMIGRKVLLTPVSILNGDSRTFEYTIDMRQISFAEADS